MLECVANVSEGRDQSVIDALSAACRVSLLDLHVDADHHRSVFTLAGPGPHGAEGAARMLAKAVARYVSLSGHEGVHPRLGALDVVPFVALGWTRQERAKAVEAALSFARWWAEAFEVPVFLYDEAEPAGTNLPAVRRRAFRTLRPDFGPSAPHPQLGATAVGARRPLVAVNCELISRDVDIARRIARAIRESNGGLVGVRALGLPLPSSGRAQVSMNLVDLAATGVEAAVLHVRDLARAQRTDIVSVELVGLVPRSELDRCADEFLAWSGLDATSTIEARIAQLQPTGSPREDG